MAAFFVIRMPSDGFWLLTGLGAGAALVEKLEQMHFAESLSIDLLENVSGWESWSGVRELSPETVAATKDFQTNPFALTLEKISGTQHVQVPLTLAEWRAHIFCSEDFCIPLKSAPAVAAPFPASAEIREDEEFWETLRVLSATPAWGKEWQSDGKAKALDVGYLAWLDRNKGCYPGQEAVEKALNLGHPARALVRFEFAADDRLTIASFAGGPLLMVDSAGHAAGAVTSVAGKYGLAVVKWKYREQEEPLDITVADGRKLTVQIML